MNKIKISFDIDISKENLYGNPITPENALEWYMNAFDMGEDIYPDGFVSNFKAEPIP